MCCYSLFGCRRTKTCRYSSEDEECGMENHICRKSPQWNGPQSSQLVGIRLKMQIRSGRPSTCNTDNKKRAVGDAIRAECCIYIRALPNDPDINFGSVRHIIRQMLCFRKVCSQQIPQTLNYEQKANYMSICLNRPLYFNIEGKTFLQRLLQAKTVNMSRKRRPCSVFIIYPLVPRTSRASRLLKN